FPGPSAGGGAYNVFAFGLGKNPGRQAVVNHVHIFGPRATNSLYLSWFQVFPKRTPAGWGLVGTEDFGLFGLPTGKHKLRTPHANYQIFGRLGSTSNVLFLGLQNGNGLVNVASVVRDRHTIKFGGEVRQVRTDNLQPNPGTTSWSFQNIFTDQRGLAGTGFDYAS